MPVPPDRQGLAHASGTSFDVAWARTGRCSVAYVVVGLMPAYSIGYVAAWASADLELIRSTAARVLTAVHRIASILTPVATDED